MTNGPRDLDDATLAKLRATMKKELRRAMTSTRTLLPRDARAARDHAIAHALAGLPELSSASVVASYVATRGEASPGSSTTFRPGTVLALPRVEVRSGTIAWHRVHAEDELVVGAFGIAEPRADAETIDPGTIDAVLVPGVAFDEAGHRLGLGKGFYDRALPSMSKATRIGIAYDFQLVAELPVEAHDVPMHLVVTDTRVARIGART